MYSTNHEGATRYGLHQPVSTGELLGLDHGVGYRAASGPRHRTAAPEARRVRGRRRDAERSQTVETISATQHLFSRFCPLVDPLPALCHNCPRRCPLHDLLHPRIGSQTCPLRPTPRVTRTPACPVPCSVMAAGSPRAAPWALATGKHSWAHAASPWSARGVGTVGRPTPLNTVTGALGRATSGLGMQSVCLCTGRAMPCGGWWIRTTTSWRGWCRAGATRTRPSRVSARCSRASRTLRVSSGPTNGSARARPSARYCPEWHTVSVVSASIGVTPRLGRRVHARIACRGAPLPGRASGCCPHMAPWPNTSAPDDRACLPRPIAKRGSNDAKVGPQAQRQGRPPHGGGGPRGCPGVPGDAIRLNKLTKPDAARGTHPACGPPCWAAVPV